MNPDDLQLPYAYTTNYQAGSIPLMIGAVVLSAALFAFSDYITPLATAVCLLPLALLGVRIFLYSLIRNAVHAATRAADMDRNLDLLIQNQIAEYHREVASRTLTPARMNDALTGSLVQ